MPFKIIKNTSISDYLEKVNKMIKITKNMLKRSKARGQHSNLTRLRFFEKK